MSQFDSKFTRQTPVDSPDDSTLSESANQVFLVSEQGLWRGRFAAGNGGISAKSILLTANTLKQTLITEPKSCNSFERFEGFEKTLVIADIVFVQQPTVECQHSDSELHWEPCTGIAVTAMQRQQWPVQRAKFIKLSVQNSLN